MRCEPGQDIVEYESLRTPRGESPARSRVCYGVSGAPYRTQPGDLDHWLSERYCLYAADNVGRILRGEVDHEPWPLAPGWVEIELNEVIAADGLPGVEGEPLVHVAQRLDVIAWAPIRLG